MEKKTRLIGIDLAKGISAYAVVLVHSATDFVATGYWSGKIEKFFGFAVPFFLAASFYLMFQKIYFSPKPFILKDRLKLLLIPYFFWTFIYCLSRSAKYILTGNFDKLSQLFKDIVSIIFFGGAAAQLYFIPLLLAGTLIVTLMMHILNKQHLNLKLLIILMLFSLVVYEFLLFFNNSFQLGKNIAFAGLLNSLQLSTLNQNPLIRVILINIAWIIRCLPYIFIAMMLNHPIIKEKLSQVNYQTTLIFSCIFLTVNILIVAEIINITGGLKELILGNVLLLFGICLSKQITSNNIITNLGLCSGGIYLIHYLIIEILTPLVSKIFGNHLNWITLLLSTTVVFGLSWLVTYFLTKIKPLAKTIF